MYIDDDSTIHQAFFSDFVSMIEKEFEHSEHSFSFELYVNDFMHEKGVSQTNSISNCSTARQYLEFVKSLKKCLSYDGIALITSFFYGTGSAVFIVVADD